MRNKLHLQWTIHLLEREPPETKQKMAINSWAFAYVMSNGFNLTMTWLCLDKMKEIDIKVMTSEGNVLCVSVCGM